MADYKKKSHKRELKIAKDIGGRATPGSGCFWNKKSDVDQTYFLIEDKFTEKCKYSVKLDILTKLEKQAKDVSKTPILTVGFECENGANFVIIRINDYNHFNPNIKILHTTKKSITVHLNDLKDMYLNSKTIVLCGLKFSVKSVIYLIIKYEDFINNLDDFIAR